MVAVPEALQPLLAPIDSVHASPRNPRRDHAIEGIAQSLASFGWHAPIVARQEDGEVIIGHGRLLAAEQLGLTRVPVLRVDDTVGQAMARMVADNRLTEMSSWDPEALASLLAESNELEELAAALDLAPIIASLPSFEPIDPADLSELDQPAPLLKCPACGHEYER